MDSLLLIDIAFNLRLMLMPQYVVILIQLLSWMLISSIRQVKYRLGMLHRIGSLLLLILMLPSLVQNSYQIPIVMLFILIHQY